MKGYVWAIIIILFLSFCVFCYHTRTNYNVDEQDGRIEALIYDRAVLSYALSITPKEVKSEVFLNSVKEKFPDVEEKEHLFNLIKVEEEEPEEEEKEKDKEKPEVGKNSKTIGDALDHIVGDLGPNS